MQKIKCSAWCTTCDCEGEYESENAEGNFYIECNECKKCLSDVWCEECGYGGDFVKNIEKKPMFWRCEECGKRIDLPKNFYNTKKTLRLLKNTQRKRAYILKDLVLYGVLAMFLFGCVLVMYYSG